MTNSFNTEVYNPVFPFDGPHLVEASAGTGKTYNIQNVCARLVMERGLRIREIQVMTFTEAATQELSDRVRNVFANLSLLFEGREDEIRNRKRERDAAEIARLQKLRDCARANIPGGEAEADAKARARVEIALLEFDQASISTIHGFCNRALRRFAFETGNAFRSELEDDKTADLTRRARDWWRANGKTLPEDSPLTLSDLTAYVTALGGKADWTLDDDEATQSGGLAIAKEIVERYEADRPLRETQTFDDLLRALRDALQGPRGAFLAEQLREEFKAVVVDEFQDTDPVQYDIFRRVFLDTGDNGAKPPLFFVGDPKQAIYSFRGGDIFTYAGAASRPDVRGATYRLDTNYRSTPRLIEAVNTLFRDRAGARTFGDQGIRYEEDLKAAEPKGVAPLLVDGAPDDKPFRIVQTRVAQDRDRAVVDVVGDILEEQGDALSPRDIAILVTSHEKGRTYRDMLKAAGIPAVLQKTGNVFSGETASSMRQVLLAMAGMGGASQVQAALVTPFFDYDADTLPAADSDELADVIGAFADMNRVWVKHGFAAAFAALESHPRCNLRARFAKMPDGERKLADVFQIVDLAGAAIRERGPSPEVLVNWLTERINLSGDKGAEKDSEEYARELESESDAVKIMTIHVSKGLEFPVVIVPVSRGVSLEPPFFHHDEDGWLHVTLDKTQPRKGGSQTGAGQAKTEADNEKTRLFYVALTRASKRTVAITCTDGRSKMPVFERLLENARAAGCGEENPPGSPILWTDVDSTQEEEKVEELLEDDVSQLADEDEPADGEAPQEEPGPADDWIGVKTPRDYGDFHLPGKGSYSSLAPSHDGETEDAEDDGRDTDAVPENAPATPENGEEVHPVFLVGGGNKTGTCWHDILEKIDFAADDAAIAEATRKELVGHGLVSRDDGGKKAEDMTAVVADMVRKTLDTAIVSPSGASFTLREVGWRDRFSEWEFHFPSAAAKMTTGSIAAILREEWRDDPGKAPFVAALDGWNRFIPKGFIKGFLDLLFRHDGYYYVVDWKSNKLDGRIENFAREGVVAEMADEGYFFQYLLYAVVLHRFLKETMGEAYSWERNFGGVRYYFLRGIAADAEAPVFEDRPSERLLNALSVALGLEG